MKDIVEVLSLIILILFIVFTGKWCDNPDKGIKGNLIEMWDGSTPQEVKP